MVGMMVAHLRNREALDGIVESKERRGERAIRQVSRG